MQIFINLLVGILFIVCFLLIIVVLMQRPKNEGLGAALGGSMMDQALGPRTTDILQQITTYLGVFFGILVLALGYLYAHNSSASSGLSKKVLPTAAAVTPTPAAAAPAASPAASPATAAPAASPAASPAAANPAAPAASPAATPEATASVEAKPADAKPADAKPADAAATATPEAKPAASPAAATTPATPAATAAPSPK
ncbi:MAG: preprotein translocase subunit SecG [Verrucomicrobia bacterium]|nr:preprotein translocase subunit SecG [Verrucomicrobiota bacterium]